MQLIFSHKIDQDIELWHYRIRHNFWREGFSHKINQDTKLIQDEQKILTPFHLPIGNFSLSRFSAFKVKGRGVPYVSIVE